jgi:transglutaminase superfamily protein
MLSRSTALFAAREQCQLYPDIAMANLLCAAAVSAASIEMGQYLSTLDKWTERVLLETERHAYRCLRDSNAFYGSISRYRVSMMLQVLQEDFAVHYDPRQISDPDYRDSRHLFIHGILDGSGGTCVSIPVLYVAIGRRLGYPLYLVEAKGHLFVRWEEMCGREVFNVEGAGNGFSSFSDSYYCNWPYPLSVQEIESEVYLKSLSNTKELALFCVTSGHCLWDNGRHGEALTMFQAAKELASDDWRYEQLCVERRSTLGNSGVNNVDK